MTSLVIKVSYDTDWYSGFKLIFPYIPQIKKNNVNLLNTDVRVDLRKKQNPFGDGRAAVHIKNFIIKRLK